MAGDLSAAEEHAGVALELGAGAEPVSAPRYHAAQLFAIRAEQLRLGEMRDVVEVIAAEDAAVPTWRVAAARILVERGELDDAAGQLDALADDDFASLPADGNWIAAVSQLVEVCRRLGDGDRAKRLYRRLAPFAELNAVVALSVICYGSSHRYLGLLAAIAGERERAREHLEHALVANGAPYSRLWLAHTQLDLAELLRGGPRAAELVGAAAAISERLAVPALDQRVCLLR
jgi:tetratricopeptide (TPR) repeat protein